VLITRLASLIGDGDNVATLLQAPEPALHAAATVAAVARTLDMFECSLLVHGTVFVVKVLQEPESAGGVRFAQPATEEARTQVGAAARLLGSLAIRSLQGAAAHVVLLEWGSEPGLGLDGADSIWQQVGAAAAQALLQIASSQGPAVRAGGAVPALVSILAAPGADPRLVDTAATTLACLCDGTPRRMFVFQTVLTTCRNRRDRRHRAVGQRAASAGRTAALSRRRGCAGCCTRDRFDRMWYDAWPTGGTQRRCSHANVCAAEGLTRDIAALQALFQATSGAPASADARFVERCLETISQIASSGAAFVRTHLYRRSHTRCGEVQSAAVRRCGHAGSAPSLHCWATHRCGFGRALRLPCPTWPPHVRSPSPT
jgi:hypothetical protein